MSSAELAFPFFFFFWNVFPRVNGLRRYGSESAGSKNLTQRSTQDKEFICFCISMPGMPYGTWDTCVVRANTTQFLYLWALILLPVWHSMSLLEIEAYPEQKLS